MRELNKDKIKKRALRAWSSFDEGDKEHQPRIHDITEKTLRYRVGPGQAFVDVKRDKLNRIYVKV
jgi:DNA-directed RNA polymerase delta subunit